MNTPKDDTNQDAREPAEECPVCSRCFTPFDPLQHYCENCGQAVGQLTPYLPFVNIRFNYSIFGQMWKTIWFEKNRSVLRKSFYLLLIVIMAPVMFLGLPFVLWNKLHSRPRNG